MTFDEWWIPNEHTFWVDVIFHTQIGKIPGKLDEMARKVWSAALASQWQPIENAPKSDTEIIVWLRYGVAVAHWSDDASMWVMVNDCGETGVEFEYWMPLPAPPK